MAKGTEPRKGDVEVEREQAWFHDRESSRKHKPRIHQKKKHGEQQQRKKEESIKVSNNSNKQT